jgi:hypothetical protein
MLQERLRAGSGQYIQEEQPAVVVAAVARLDTASR